MKSIEKPTMEVVRFDSSDVVATSNCPTKCWTFCTPDCVGVCSGTYCSDNCTQDCTCVGAISIS